MKKTISRHIIFKQLQTKDFFKKLFLKASREKTLFTYREYIE